MLPTSDLILPGVPQPHELRLRHFQGESDLPAMVVVTNAAYAHDNEERVETLDEMAPYFLNPVNFDPRQDVFLAEINSELAGYGRVSWRLEQEGKDLILFCAGFVHPAQRRKGIGSALLGHNLRRLEQVARQKAGLPGVERAFFESYASSTNPGGTALLERAGFAPVRQSNVMVRPDLENLPEIPLPAGLDVRPALPTQYRQVWNAMVEAFSDHWGHSEMSDTDFHNYCADPTFQPEIWQVAWDGDEVAGMVLNYIHHAENQAFGRKRGYTEGICVRKPWRGRGLARALLARSLQTHRQAGVAETALTVDTENSNGALRFYESMGYRTVRAIITYRKPAALPAAPGPAFQLQSN